MVNVKTLHIVLLCLMISLLGGCGWGGQDAKPEAAAPVPDAPILGYLDTRHYRLTICSGLQEPLYTVTDAQGSVLARDLSQLELSVRFPELQQVVETGMAELDARVAPSPLDGAR